MGVFPALDVLFVTEATTEEIVSLIDEGMLVMSEEPAVADEASGVKLSEAELSNCEATAAVGGGVTTPQGVGGVAVAWFNLSVKLFDSEPTVS